MTPNRLLHHCVSSPALLAVLLLCACAGPRSDSAAQTPSRPDATTPALPPPPLADARTDQPIAVAPGIAVGESRPAGSVVSGPASPGAQQLSCKTDADCSIKDVGSCCGYQPRCLNKDAQTFPERVQAQCAKEGRVSHCGIMAITSCECLEGKCAPVTLSDNSSVVQ